MFGSGYAVGLIVATVFGLWLESLRRKHNRKRIELKRKQRAEILAKKIKDKSESIKIKAKIVSNNSNESKK